MRDALLDIQVAQKQVEVAQSSMALARRRGEKQAQERYATRVSDNLGVSQAQQSVAQATTSTWRAFTGTTWPSQPGAALGAGATPRPIWGEVNVADTNPTPAPSESVAETKIVQPQSRRRGIFDCWWWWFCAGCAWASGGGSTYSEDTDDAQVNGHLIQVSSRIAGQVVKVDVEENQVVKAGDTIAELDPRDYQVAVENAQAALASAEAMRRRRRSGAAPSRRRDTEAASLGWRTRAARSRRLEVEDEAEAARRG